MQGWSQEFLFGGLSYNANIFIKTTPHTHTHAYIYMLFLLLYTHIFFLRKMYTHFFI